MSKKPTLLQIANLAINKHKTIAIAESCTGGLISHTLTNLSGSSKYFKFGAVVYSDESKTKILNISPKKIKQFGAVSEHIATEMAENVRTIAKTDIGLSCTGIAGPLGGNKEKPIGTVYIGIVSSLGSVVKKFNFSGSRSKIKIKTKDKALQLLTKCLRQL